MTVFGFLSTEFNAPGVNGFFLCCVVSTKTTGQHFLPETSETSGEWHSIADEIIFSIYLLMNDIPFGKNVFLGLHVFIKFNKISDFSTLTPGERAIQRTTVQ